MKKQFQSLTEKGRWLLATLTLIFTLGIGQMWGDEIFGFTCTSSTTAVSSTGYTATGGTATLSGSAMSTGSSNEMTVGTQTFYKFNSSSQWTFALSSGKFAVGDVISFTCASNASNDKSGKGVKINNSITVTGDFPKGETNTISYTVVASDGVAGQSSFYIKRNDSDIKFGTVSVTRTATGPVDPTITFNDGAYTVGATALDLSSLFSSNSAGAVTYSVKTDGGTSASIDGTNFTATAAGTCVVTASQAAETGKYNAKAVDANIVVSAAAVVTCPESGVVYSMTMKSKSLSGVTQNTEVALVAGDYATEDGGTAYLGNKNSDAGKAQIKTDGGGTVYYNGNDAYVKIELDCPLKADDKITFVPGSGTRQLCFTTSSTRTDTYQTSSNSFAITSEFLATAANADNVKTIYVWRIGSSTYLHSLTITRPYNISFSSAKGTAPSATKGFEVELAQITGVDGWVHTGWTANAAVKVGSTDKAAGAALDVDATVTVSSDVTFTAVWEEDIVQHTVTYYDNTTVLGSEDINEGGNPTATGIVAPRKLGYTFAGWSTTNGGAAVALNTIPVAADMPLYAVYSEINCAASSGTIFSLAMDVAPVANCTIKSGSGFETEADLDQYAAISGGIAIAENSSSNNHLIITTDPYVQFQGGNGYVHISFDCALKEGDKIKTTIYNQNIAYTTTGTRTTSNTFTKGENQELTITKNHVLENATEIYLWAASSNGGKLSSLEVIRPAKYAVTFNMHDHGDAVPAQSIVEGGKVTEPATTDITGWDFGGWYKESTFENEWDFASDVVGTSAIELHAKWTEHVLSNDVSLKTLSVNGEAIAIVPSQLVYAVELPFGTTATPTVTATANDENVKAFTITQATAVDGSATIYVKAEDNTTEATYTINFSVATSKDIELVWDKSKKRCDNTNPDANVKSNDESVSAYINTITFTGGGAEGSSLNVGNTAGNMFTLSAKAGYAFQAMSFFGKIQDATCEYSLDGGAWTELASTKTDGDKCYSDVFSAAEVHEFRLRSTGNSGVWIRNMQLNIVEACTPIVVAWDEEPVEFEVGKSGYAIAATANNSGTVAYSSTDGDVIAVNGSTGALTVSALGSVTLKAATAEGDGTTYCANGGNNIEISKAVNTYYLVKFDAQNGDAATEVKYYSGDAAIALPDAPSYSGYDFQGWFDAETGGNQYTAAITPAASMTVYAQWVAQCAGATITTQPTGASYLTGRTPVALVCEATAGAGGALTYEWFTCDDAMRTNPVAATATPSTAVAGTFYYFCKVTEAGCDVEAFSNVVTITVADKDPICLIATTVTGATAHGDVTGFLGEDRGGDAEVNVTGDSYKMDKGKYIGVTLPEGYKFQEGDKVVLNVMTVNNATGFTLFDGKDGEKNLIIDTRDGNLVPAGANTVVLPAYAGSQSVYVLRENNNTTGDLNSAINAIAVYRTCAPILNKVTVNGAEGKPNALKEVVFEVAASTTQSQLEAIAFDWVSNDDAWTAANAPVAANAWEFGVANTVTFTDKDGDESVYTITVNKAAASTNIELATLTVNGNAVTVDPGQAVYNYELPYGTSAAPVVAATAEDANADLGTITQATSTTGSATFTVTAEDGTTTRDYTINFSVSLWKEVVIWDGSTMTAVATSPDAITGFAWAVNGFSSITNYNATCGTKAYTKTLPSGGSASASRNVAFTVPAGYVAKFYIAFGTHSDGNNRGMFIGTTATKTLDETSVLTLYSDSRTNLTDGTSEIVGAGTYYLNPMESEDFYEIRAYLRPGYARTSMLGAGVYGTLCVDHNVAIEDIQGATMYELMGREPQYGKLAFDEIVSGELEAGKPYVFQAHGDKLLLFYGNTKVVNPVNGNGMYGTFQQIVLSGSDLDDVYYFAQKALWSCDGAEDLTVAANRAYVKLSQVTTLSDPNPAPGRRRVTMAVNGEKVATGMDELNASDKPVKVMIDGQMYILRGEKMYDATGRLVK